MRFLHVSTFVGKKGKPAFLGFDLCFPPGGSADLHQVPDPSNTGHLLVSDEESAEHLRPAEGWWWGEEGDEQV